MVHSGENHHADIYTYGADAIALTWPYRLLLSTHLNTFRLVQICNVTPSQTNLDGWTVTVTVFYISSFQPVLVFCHGIVEMLCKAVDF